MLSPGTILQNRYRIVRELGHGGMGTVYEAVDQRVNCIVALKETTAGNDREAKRAFEREASLLANLRHSTLPKVMDYFTEGDGDFLVMEFIPGYDLAELLESRDGPFPQNQVLRWAFELLRVLEYLHKQEPPILHRDIKPSNLKLTKNGEVFLLDFGLAKGALGQMPTLAASRSVRGYTPIYASLEQIHGQGTDPRSDLYSLGATLYHLLSGVPPIDAPTRFHVIEDGDPDPLKPIPKVNPQASSSVAGLIHQAMALSRKDRPISAGEMMKALRNAAEEDERSAAEEEYSRAEEKRRQREDERLRAEREAARRAEEERLQREAEIREKEEKARLSKDRELEEKRRAREAARKRADEERKRAEADEQRQRAERRKAEERARPDALNATKPGSTIPAKDLVPPREVDGSQIKTIPAPPPDRFVAEQLLPRSTHREEESTAPVEPRSKIKIISIAVGILVVVAVVIVLSVQPWSQPSSNANSPSVPQNETANSKSAPTGMVYVPGGTFMMGRNSGGDDAERPQHQVTVKPYFIDKYEVLSDDYETWIQGKRVSSKRVLPPATNVDWDNANRYCTNMQKRLPTEEEWEFAARGTDGRIYPWGNEWQSGAANAGGESSRTSDIGVHKGYSPFGIYDMVGNVWEWTASDFRAYPGGQLPASLPAGDLKVIRGGSYESDKDHATTTYRTGWPARGAKTYDQTGFRCVKDVN